jgi:hypothetical protein
MEGRAGRDREMTGHGERGPPRPKSGVLQSDRFKKGKKINKSQKTKGQL